MVFRPSLWMTLFAAIAIAILITLGTWQVQRLHWKTDVLAEVAALQSAPAVALPNDPAQIQPYRLYELSGEWVAGADKLFGLNERGRAGYGLIQLFQADSGARFVVNRGYVPSDLEEAPDLLTGPAQITGKARLGGWQGSQTFAPRNSLTGDSVVFIDPEIIEQRLNSGQLQPLFFELQAPKPEARYPTPVSSKLDIANNHLSYAITWYSFAGILLVIYVLRSLRRREEKA